MLSLFAVMSAHQVDAGIVQEAELKGAANRPSHRAAEVAIGIGIHRDKHVAVALVAIEDIDTDWEKAHTNIRVSEDLLRWSWRFREDRGFGTARVQIRTALEFASCMAS